MLKNLLSKSLQSGLQEVLQMELYQKCGKNEAAILEFDEYLSEQ